MKTSSQANSGFTLIELAITLVIFSIMAAVAVPFYNAWIQKGHVRGAAESIRDGVQRARAEAVARNRSVQFVIGGDYFWAVIVDNEVGVDDEVIESRGTGETPDSVTLTMTPDDATTVTFGGVGTVVGNADGSAAITQVDLASTALSDDIGKLRVVVGAGGATRVCDPYVAVGDVRSCG